MSIFFPPPPPFVGGAQPNAGHLGTVSAEAVPVNNPPFSHAGRLAATMAAVLLWQPPPPDPFIGARQPLELRKLAPGVPGQSVDAPPIPVPEPTIVARWAWEPPDPAPILRRPLAPAITAVPVNNPPTIDALSAANLELLLGAWQPTDPAPLLPGKLPQGQAVQWQSTPRLAQVYSVVLPAWQPPEPLPTLETKLPPALSAVPVNNPPFGQRDPSLDAALLGWRPGDPLPTLTVKLAQGGAATVAQTPYGAAWLATVVASWQPSDPAPQAQPRRLAGIPGYSVDPPPSRGSEGLQALLRRSWEPPDPLPALEGKLSPGIPGQSVDPPPQGLLQRAFTAIAAAWRAVTGAPQSQQQVAAIIPPPVVNNPPPRLWAVPDAILRAWDAPFPPPPQPRPGVPSPRRALTAAPPWVIQAPVTRYAVTAPVTRYVSIASRATMPQMRDFPPIAIGEIRTLGWDLAPSLPAGDQLTGAPTVTCTVAALSPVQDAQASSRIVAGTPEVATIPVANGGTGNTNTSMQFQFTAAGSPGPPSGCVYLLQAFEADSDSDSDQPLAWGHITVIAPS